MLAQGLNTTPSHLSYERDLLLQLRPHKDQSNVPFPFQTCKRQALLRQLTVHRSVQECREIKHSLQKPFQTPQKAII